SRASRVQRRQAAQRGRFRVSGAPAMSGPLLAAFDLFHWETCGIAALSLVFVFLAWRGGRVLLGHRRRFAHVPAPGPRPAASTSVLSRTTERRRTPRCWVRPVEVLLSNNWPYGEVLWSWVVNRSAEGLGLSASQPVEVNTVL